MSTSWAVITPGQRQDIRAWSPNTQWNDPANLVTTTTYYTSGPNINRVQSILNPDGTMQIYQYGQAADGSQTNILYSGQPNSGQTAIINGTEDVTILGPVGQMVSHTVTDVSSGIITLHDVYSDYDQFNRPQEVTHLDGTTEDTQYSSCCGHLESMTDKDGVSTVYLYDQANRQVGYQSIYGTSVITYSNLLDSVGHTLQSIRIGSDQSAITTGQSQYNLLGQLTAQVNALNGTTTYAEDFDPVTGAQMNVTVNPDGGTITNDYYVDGTLKETSGTAVHGVRYEYGVISDYNSPQYGDTYTVEIKLKPDGTDTTELSTNFTDCLGRSIETVYADGSTNVSYYNSLGQLSFQIDPDGVTNLFAYDGEGEQTFTAVALSGSPSISFSGKDRITETTNDVISDHGMGVNRTRTYVWTQNGSDSPVLTSTMETSVNGLDSWQTTYRDAGTPVTSESQTSYGGGGGRTTVVTAPDGSYTINAYSYGRLVSSTRYDSTGAQIGAASYAYDPHGRQCQVTDGRNGTTTYLYDSADLVTNATTPNPGDGPAETTITYYNQMLQAAEVLQPDDTAVYSDYLLTGELGLQYGSRTYPVAYGYDYAGRMATMTNWSDFSGDTGARVTTWNYDPYRGFLASKTYDGNTAGPSYTYTPAGRLKTRTWARGVTTTYSYDNGGSLSGVTYSDGTPGITYTDDRLGRQSTILQNGMTDTLGYNLANQLLSESFSGGILNGLSVTNGYDQFLRRTNLVALSSLSPLLSSAIGYDAASRLQTVSDGNGNSATYTYLANSPLVSQIAFKQNSTTRMTTTKQYDNLNRLTQISSVPSAGYTPASTFNYSYNSANQRTKDVLNDGSYWVYQYDSLGQVTNGVKYFADGTPVAGQQFGYLFDDIGNRTQTASGGDATGQNLRLADYSANNLNQIISRDVPGYLDVIGVSYATNVVTVNGQTAYRHGEYFRSEVPVNNSSSAQWQGITVSASGQPSVSGNEFVPETPEAFTYDADGNLKSDGRFNYYWDGENRLTNITSLASDPTGSKVKVDFVYDWQGRRIQKTVWTNNGSAYVPEYTNNFVYDGWNLLAILNPQSSILSSFTWGSDLSGSQQGAGGVGGLLEVSEISNSQITNFFVAYDGNGNVAALVNAADGTVSANYEYGPFGEVIRQTGPMAKTNPIRFSTKYQDDESDWLYYGFRYYHPGRGTWVSRDPKWEEGFETSLGHRITQLTLMNLVSEAKSANLYALLKNNVANDVDVFGLCGCHCGDDVTRAVFATEGDIARTFANASLWTKWEAQEDMFYSPFALASWDIAWLKGYRSPINPSDCDCGPTVTFEGRCVSVDELNYIMFGWGMYLCLNPANYEITLQEMDAGLQLEGQPLDVIGRKIGFAELGAGLYSDNNWPTWMAWPRPCLPSKTVGTPNITDWYWWGLKWGPSE